MSDLLRPKSSASPTACFGVLLRGVPDDEDDEEEQGEDDEEEGEEGDDEGEGYSE